VSGTVAVGGSGTISVPNLNLTGLDDVSLTVSVMFTDTVGNEAAVTQVLVSKDTQVSAATNVQLNGGVTILAVDQGAVDLTFDTTEEGTATYAISDGSTNVTGSVAVTMNGTTTVENINVSTLNDGTLSLSVVFTDSVGNVAPAGLGSVVKDSNVDAPTNVQLNGGLTISSATQSSVDLTFVTTEAGEADYVISDGTDTISGSIAVAGAGTTTVAGLNVSALNDGTLEISVVFTDTPGNESGEGTGSVGKDTQVNAATAVNLNNGAGVNASTATSSTLMFTTDEAGNATYTISGTGAVDVTGSVAVVDGVNMVNNLNLSAFADGTLDLSVVFTDSVGNTAAAATGTAQKDVVVDSVTNVQLNGGVTINASMEASVDLTFETTETGSAEYRISDGVNPDLTGTIAVSTAGLVTVPALDVRTLNNGTLNLSVIFTDDLGNEAAAGLGSVIKDSDIPQAPQNVQLNGGVTINASTAGSVNITGTVAEAGTLLYAIVDALNNDVNGSMIVSSGAFTVSGLDVSDLEEGTLTVYVTLTDASGNTSLDGNQTVKKDVVVQSATNVALHGGVVINAASEADVDLTFTTTESGSAVYVVTDGFNIVTDMVIVTAAGIITVEGIDVSSLDDGSLDISIVFTDDAGNVAAAGLSTVVKDATIPQSPQSVQLNGGVTIIQATQTSLDLTGTVGEAGTLEYVISDGITTVSGSEAVGVGSYTVSGINVSSLNDGTLDISVTVTDAALNTSAVGTATVEKDTQISAATNVQLNGGVTINAAAQAGVTLVFDTNEAGSAVYTISDGVSPGISDSVAVSGAGTTTVSGLNLSSLNDGTLNISVVFTDTAGNTAAAGLGMVPKDTQVAAPQNVSLNNQVPLNAATASSVALSGDVAEAGTLSYGISDGTSSVSASSVVGSGAFSLAGIDLSGLSDGVLVISVSLTDEAGNVSSVAQVGLLKDTVIADPTALVINGGQPVTSADETAVSLTFSVAETGTVEYAFTDGTDTVIGSEVLASAGAQTLSLIDVSSLAEGMLTLTLNFSDDVGNIAGEVSDTVLKDTIAQVPTNFVINGSQAVNLANQSLVYFRATFSETGSLTYLFTDSVHSVSDTVPIPVAEVVTVSNIDLSGFDEGTISASLVFTDELGNVSVTVLGTVEKDTLVNSAAQVILNSGAMIGGETASSVSLSFVVTETGTANYVITDENNNMVAGTYVVSTIGTVVITGIDVSGLANGLLTPSVQFVDEAGNSAMVTQGTSVQKVDVVPVSSGGGRRRLFSFLEQPVASSGGGGSVLSESVSKPVEEAPEEDVLEEKEEKVVLPFVDLTEEDDEYEAVRSLYIRGIVRGQGNSSRFDASGVVDWAQALKMLLLLSEQEVPSEVTEPSFPEVEIGVWFAPYFALAKKLGYINGGPKGSVIPWQAINRAEAVVLTYRILGLRPKPVSKSSFSDVEADVWFSDALHDAVNKGLLTTRQVDGQRLADPTSFVTRAEFVMLLVGVGE